MLIDQLQSGDSKILLEMLYKIRGKQVSLDEKLDFLLSKTKNGDKTIKSIDAKSKQVTQDLMIASGIVKE